MALSSLKSQDCFGNCLCLSPLNFTINNWDVGPMYTQIKWAKYNFFIFRKFWFHFVFAFVALCVIVRSKESFHHYCCLVLLSYYILFVLFVPVINSFNHVMVCYCFKIVVGKRIFRLGNSEISTLPVTVPSCQTLPYDTFKH